MIRKPRLSLQLKVVLVLAALTGVGLFLWQIKIDRMDQQLTGTPVSWGYKARMQQLPQFFAGEGALAARSRHQPQRPAIDLTQSGATEVALFALG